MIVAPRFRDDTDDEAQLKQHDTYGYALRTIIEVADKYAEFAKKLLGDEKHPDWGLKHRAEIDHRTLQEAHDLLAAAWRYQHAFRRQLTLSFPENRPDEPTEVLWLRWLRAEIESWSERPDMVRYIQIILTSQNDDKGYEAERALATAIKDKFYEAPWLDRQ